MTATKVGHCKKDETDVYIGRGNDQADMISATVNTRGWLGNPYTLEEYDREESIAKFQDTFEARINSDAQFRKAVRNLHGKTLGCWCQTVAQDEPACHGEVIAEWADKLATEAKQ